MKKVLSLLLVCTMILSFAAMTVVNAAGEGYTIVAAQVGTKKVGPSTKLNFDATATTYNSYTHYTDATWEATETVEAIALQVSTKTAAAAGYVAIDYDETKVTPAAITYADGSVYGQTYSALVDGGLFGQYAWVQTGGTATITEAIEATAVSNGNLVVTWSGALAADEVVCYITFFCKSGVTTANFDADTFALSEDSAFLSTYKLQNGSAMVVDTSSVANAAAANTTLTYPNSTVVPGGDDEEEETTWKDTVDYAVTESVKFPTTKDEIEANSPTGTLAGNKIVVFAKNTTALTGTKDGEANYGITVGGKYYPGYLSVPANSSWAIILADPNSNILNGTYSVLIKAEGETITGTAQTVSAN